MHGIVLWSDCRGTISGDHTASGVNQAHTVYLSNSIDPRHRWTGGIMARVASQTCPDSNRRRENPASTKPGALQFVVEVT